MATENRTVKSDVFSMLMENKVYALQVYNALKGSDYQDPDMVEMCRLESGISLSIRNDASFIIDMHLGIYEHQSTYNPNMPLRSLIYVVGIFKNLISNTNLYRRKLIKLPTPHFVVFYNGVENRPPLERLRLSDSFEIATEEPMLELICDVININSGKNDDFLDKCSVLSQYTQFIEKVREFDSMDLEKPIKAAIDWCVENGILADFLKKRRQEVIDAMTIDMTFERREELIRKEEFEDGFKSGVEEGYNEGISEVVINALKNGKTPEEVAEFNGIELDKVLRIQSNSFQL